MNLGIISDLHAPYQHPDALEFLKRIKTIYKISKWLNVGDEVFSVNPFNGKLVRGRITNINVGYSQCLSIIADTNQVLYVTESHPILCNGKDNYYPIKNLLNSDEVSVSIINGWEQLG